jgi:hypothetical protein
LCEGGSQAAVRGNRIARCKTGILLQVRHSAFGVCM